MLEAAHELIEALPVPVEVPSEVEVVEEPIPISILEPVFAARVPPPLPERPRPTFRRAMLLDVENTSRAQDIEPRCSRTWPSISPGAGSS